MSVSPRNIIFSLVIPNLSALNFTCSADSSPETYSTFPSVLNLLQSSKISVDFPIPGSPPTNTSEPFTKPPPNTLSSSLYPVGILIDTFPSTLFSTFGLAASFALPSIPTIFCSFSS